MKAAKLAVICFMVGCIFSAQGHQHYHHSHGEGVLFVVHDQDKWQVKFILPAGDIFGFEHQPETAEQKQPSLYTQHSNGQNHARLTSHRLKANH